jgi:DNA-directed RNA polymerase specialized sigma24 family protein
MDQIQRKADEPPDEPRLSEDSLEPPLFDESSVVENAVVLEIQRIQPAAREGQLAKDHERLLLLQLEGFNGRAWRDTRQDLIFYARRVLRAKIRSGEIFSIMRSVGIPMAVDLALPSDPPTLEDCRDLADETIARALPPFKALLKDGVWDPTRDHVASLRTFFIGYCALKFTSAWRPWLRARNSEPEVLYVDPTNLPELVDESHRTEQTAVDRVSLGSVLRMLPDHLMKQILILDAHDWSNRNIASYLGVSEKVVEYRLNKARKMFPHLRDNLHQST